MIAIEKTTEVFGVGVEVQHHRGLLPVLKDVVFEMVDGWSDCLGGPFPGAIGVYSCEFCPGVAMDDTIWIDHGHNFKYKLI